MRGAPRGVPGRVLRERLRHAGDALAGCPIGTVPILWADVDAVPPRPVAGPSTILDEIAAAAYEGTQLGTGFPEADALRSALASRDLRLAEVYAALPATADGPARDALDVGRERLRLLAEGGGDVLVVALDGSPERERMAGRAESPATPRLSDGGWARLGEVLDSLAAETIAAGCRLAFHPHAATFVETPAEMGRLVAATDPGRVGVCLDVGHFLVGGGDPVAAIRALGPRVTHVHLKDVDPDVLGALRSGELPGFAAAVRARIFTELGAGALDLPGCLRALEATGFAGWLMVEQDSSWYPPAEAAAIGRRVLAATLAALGSEPQGARNA